MPNFHPENVSTSQILVSDGPAGSMFGTRHSSPSGATILAVRSHAEVSYDSGRKDSLKVPTHSRPSLKVHHAKTNGLRRRCSSINALSRRNSRFSGQILRHAVLV